MSFRATSVAVVLAFGVASCGGDDSATTTVVQTVTAPGAAAPPPVAATAPPAAATTPTEPAAAPAEPVANLPAGAIAVQGRYRMRVVKSTDNTYVASPDKREIGAQRDWIAETVCEDVCRVRLRRQLTSGAFERATLEQGVDERSFGETSKVEAKYCVNTEFSTGPATKRLSLRITAVEDRAGQPTARRIDGYFTVRQLCAQGITRLQGRATDTFRGALEG